MLIPYMNRVLKQRVFTDTEQINHVNVLDDIGEMLYEAQPESMRSDEFEAVSLRLLEISDYERCKKWCDRAVIQYPTALSSYTCQLKLYFSTEEKEAFFRVLDELRQSGITIDRETLDLIRVFL